MKIQGLIISLIVLCACVPQRKYQDLQKNYDDEVKKEADCNKKQADLQDKLDESQKALADRQARLSTLKRDADLLDTSYRKLSLLYNQTNIAYERLLDKVKELESQNKVKTQELSSELLETRRQLNEKEKELTTKAKDLGLMESDLNRLKTDLQEREKRVAELSKVLNQKDSVVKALKTSISNSLLGFSDKGISVNIRNGKVYVSVEEKLLFQSGKYAVNSEGRKALLQLAQALNQQSDVSIMVEGHTDNVPYISSGVIKDNLDLSVMRATEVARILAKEGKVDPSRIVAAGKGDTQPIASNETPDGRAKNRRTEIILTPHLSELFKVLDQN